MIKRVLPGLFACSLSISSHALSVELYEDYLAQRAAGVSINKAMPPVLMQAYLIGVAEALAFLHTSGGNKVVLGSASIICLPPGNAITSDLLTAVASAELQQHREHYEKSYGTDWKRMALSTVFVTGLQRMFPSQF